MKVIEPPRPEATVLRPVGELGRPEDLLDNIREWSDGCVVHLCGCNCQC